MRYPVGLTTLLIAAAVLAAVLISGSSDASHEEPDPCGWLWSPDVRGAEIVYINDIWEIVTRFGDVEGDVDYRPALDYDRDGAITLADITPAVAQFGATPIDEVRIQDVTDLAGFEVELPYTGEPPAIDTADSFVSENESSTPVVFQSDDGERLKVGVVDFTQGAAESGSGLLLRVQGADGAANMTWIADDDTMTPLLACF